ncbi:g1976 [Coccomyxa viridis]|uniref:G1976 protein n=1 Tax=Coccomyxa viridis TaxID=1274662 RepID=A0ABP1FJ89_9CHLO
MQLNFPKGTPDTTTEGIMEKLIERGWGGYCYESNNLLAKALKTLGFEVYSVGARNVDEKSAEFALQCGTHEIVLARVLGSAVWYVVDAAWGSGTPHKPIAVREWRDEESSGSSHRIRRGFVDSVSVPTEKDLATRPERCGWYMQKYSRTKQKWQDLYFLTERADLQPDFIMMNFWISNHHSSIFREGLRISIRNDCGGYGRTTMMNNHLKVYDMEGQLIEDRVIESVPDFEEALRVHFCIVH